jgi:2-alkyl-3-oxoalkanoate reductase
MRVFIAGRSGAIGVPLIRRLVGAGHEVTALTRTRDKESMLRALGATAAFADALDAEALRRVIVAARPSHVIHQLTALPKMGPRRARDLEPTNRLRIDGTRYLIAASVAAGAKRIVAGSFALFRAARGDEPADVRAGIDAVVSMESQILEANRRGTIEGVVLRYGLFYGAEVPSTQQMIALVRRRLLPIVRGDRSLLPCIHIEDAASATVLALDRAPAGRVRHR